jgi:hypothetical protein
MFLASFAAPTPTLSSTPAVDELCSTSATAPTLPTNYTKKQRIGSFKTDGTEHILAFSQLGDEFIWATPVTDVNVTTMGTTPVALTLASVPSGVQVNALVRGYMAHTTAAANGLLFPTGDLANRTTRMMGWTPSALCVTSLDGYGHKTEHKNGKGNAGDDPAVAAQGSVLVEHYWLAPAAQPA